MRNLATLLFLIGAVSAHPAMALVKVTCFHETKAEIAEVQILETSNVVLVERVSISKGQRKEGTTKFRPNQFKIVKQTSEIWAQSSFYAGTDLAIQYTLALGYEAGLHPQPDSLVWITTTFKDYSILPTSVAEYYQCMPASNE